MLVIRKIFNILNGSSNPQICVKHVYDLEFPYADYCSASTAFIILDTETNKEKQVFLKDLLDINPFGLLYNKNNIYAFSVKDGLIGLLDRLNSINHEQVSIDLFTKRFDKVRIISNFNYSFIKDLRVRIIDNNILVFFNYDLVSLDKFNIFYGVTELNSFYIFSIYDILYEIINLDNDFLNMKSLSILDSAKNNVNYNKYTLDISDSIKRYMIKCITLKK